MEQLFISINDPEDMEVSYQTTQQLKNSLLQESPLLAVSQNASYKQSSTPVSRNPKVEPRCQHTEIPTAPLYQLTPKSETDLGPSTPADMTYFRQLFAVHDLTAEQLVQPCDQRHLCVVVEDLCDLSPILIIVIGPSIYIHWDQKTSIEQRLQTLHGYGVK